MNDIIIDKIKEWIMSNKMDKDKDKTKIEVSIRIGEYVDNYSFSHKFYKYY